MTLSSKEIFRSLSTNKWITPVFLLIVALVVSIHSISLGVNNFWGGHYTHYNNYVIFKNSFSHLIHNQNLYSLYLDIYADQFKYSPSFALSMVLFYYLPDSLGLIMWNSINILVLYYSFLTFTSIDPSKRFWLILFVLFELILSTQNAQSNALLAGLTILAFHSFEKGRNAVATLFILIGAFIKIYSVIGLLLILFYPRKAYSAISSVAWTIVLFCLPLLVVNLHWLTWQYHNWYESLIADKSNSIGMSIFAWTRLISASNYLTVLTFLAGAILLLFPLVKRKQWENYGYRLKYLALLLIWIVVFNHKAESPTYIIAMTGIGIWYFSSSRVLMHKILIFMCLFFTSIWFTDIVPHSIRKNMVEAGLIKSFMPIIMLFLIFFNLILKRRLMGFKTNPKERKLIK